MADNINVSVEIDRRRYENICEWAYKRCPFAKDKEVFYKMCIDSKCTLDIVPDNFFDEIDAVLKHGAI